MTGGVTVSKVTRISEALAAAWPARFLPMPSRAERVGVIVAHHALRAEIRRRGEATGGAVSGEDLARWVESVIIYTRAVRTLTALQAIREAGTTYHLHAGGIMERANGTAAVGEVLELQQATLNYTLESAIQHFEDGLGEFLRFCDREIQNEVTAKQVGSLLQRSLPALVEGIGPGQEELTVRAAAIARALHTIGFHLYLAPGELPPVAESPQ